jgi:hypothetical protein
MTPKIADRCIEPHRSLSPNDLKRAFKMAMAKLHEPGVADQKRLQYRTPIVQRGVSQADTEERALKDAARALAQLWRV